MLSDGVRNYAWDARSHLSTIDAGSTGSFVYDPAGRRATKVISGTQTNFFYDLANPVQELSGTTPTANLLTGGVDEYFTRTDASGTANFLTDALGSTAALTDGTGTVQTQYTFDPFGSSTQSGASANSFTYTGRENDGTGLYYYRARYYNPQIGRFISEDPAGFTGSGPNLYGYVYGSPTNLRDPYGFSGCDQSCLNQIAILEDLFPGSSFKNGVLTIPQSTDVVNQVLVANGYQQPGQWWNVFLYWDPIAHSGGDEYRLPVDNSSFHFRKPYPPPSTQCSYEALEGLYPGSCWQPQLAGRKTTLDEFHTDDHDPARFPAEHLFLDFFGFSGLEDGPPYLPIT